MRTDLLGVQRRAVGAQARCLPACMPDRPRSLPWPCLAAAYIASPNILGQPCAQPVARGSGAIMLVVTVITLATLPQTQAEFPGIMMLDYDKSSMSWPCDNIVAIARTLLLVASLACVGATACSRSAVVERRSESAMMTLRHPNGLALHAPEKTYDVRQTPAGFRLQAVGSAQQRNPVSVIVELRPGRAPAGDFPEQRAVRGRPFRYRVDIEEGGSSGDEHVLRAWTSAGTQHVWIEQATAAEPPAKPDFAAAWQIADGLDVPAS